MFALGIAGTLKISYGSTQHILFGLNILHGNARKTLPNLEFSCERTHLVTIEVRTSNSQEKILARSKSKRDCIYINWFKT